jgi:predicted DNA binding CopG/RHH family protein
MENLKLSAEEMEILRSVENNEWSSVENKDDRLLEIRSYIKHQKKKAISIRIAENDIYELKRKSMENGIPYQNLIQILLHQFVSDKITLKL